MPKGNKIRAYTDQAFDRVVTCEYDYTPAGAWIIRCRGDGFAYKPCIARPCVYSLRHWKGGEFPDKGEDQVVAAAIEWYEVAAAALDKAKDERPPGRRPPGRPVKPCFYYLGRINDGGLYAVGIRYDWTDDSPGGET